jgi:hypothetical protein
MAIECSLNHMVMTVKDIDKSFESYIAQGFDAYLAPVMASVADYTFRGKHISKAFKYKMAFVQKGPFLLKLVQPLGGDSPYQEYLDKKGEGICHIHFTVPDLEKAKAEMADNGFTMIYEADHRAYKEAYFDTSKIFNMDAEFRQEA